jgi:hypothetical protein
LGLEAHRRPGLEPDRLGYQMRPQGTGEASMRKQQRGVTLIGWVILLAPVALVFYVAIRVMPVYLNYMKVARTLEQVKGEVSADSANAATIRNAIEKHFDVESVDYPTVKDVKISREGRSWVIQAAYDDQAPLFANAFILLTFDKTVKIGGGGPGE